MPAFGATNKPGTCLWCGRKLVMVCDTTWENTDKAKPPQRCTYCHVEDGEWELDEQRPFPGIPGPPWLRCKSCGESTCGTWIRKIKSRVPRHDLPGAYGDGFFCSLNCGRDFGVAAASNNFRLRPIAPVPAPAEPLETLGSKLEAPKGS